MRALETGRAMLTATNSGITAAIDRDGRVLARLPQFVEGRLDHGVRSYAGVTPYVRVGDAGALAAIALALGAAFLAHALRKR
jgi:apolipoprotein N-acyltransferase